MSRPAACQTRASESLAVSRDTARARNGSRQCAVAYRVNTVAALYVQTDGSYYGLTGVEPWDQVRDARQYAGPYPVVAHPPCSRWCQLAYINQARYGHRVGDDGGCFAAALDAVRRWGGVLEHPAFSYAWPAFGLPEPPAAGWQLTVENAWVCQVSQGAYGHRARKLTWLYYIGDRAPPVLSWDTPAPTAQVSWCRNHGNSTLPRMSKKTAARTPPAFRDLLIQLARGAHTSIPSQT